METKEYFKGIAETVQERRRKDKLNLEEKKIWEEARRQACRDILIMMGTKQRYGDLMKKFSKAVEFLKKEKNFGKLATMDADTEIWEKPLSFDSSTLMDLVLLQISDLKMRLKKAREIHIFNMGIIEDLKQITIDD